MKALHHSSHDYPLLLTRWEEVCRAAGLGCTTICTAGGYPVLKVENALAAAGETGGLYASAGVHGDECAPVWALLEWVASAPEILRQRPFFGCHFDVAATLHEDYDATGIYLYELIRGESMGDGLLHACEIHLPRERASVIDGSDFTNGLLMRTSGIEEVVEEHLGGGYPEAILLYLNHARSSYTFETPSEADLVRRIAAHRAFLEALAASTLNLKIQPA